jgi:uncharacterized protein with HEPN domain
LAVQTAGHGCDLSKYHDYREAARQVDESFRRTHLEIPWSSLIGARNIVMHAYEYLKPELIKEMVEKDVPALLAHCLHILGEQ